MSSSSIVSICLLIVALVFIVQALWMRSTNKRLDALESDKPKR